MVDINGYHIKMTRGDTAVFAVSIFDKDGKEYVMQASDQLVFTVGESNCQQTQVLQILSNTPEITISPEDTQCIPYGDYVYNIALTTADGINTIIPCSKFSVTCKVGDNGDMQGQIKAEKIIGVLNYGYRGSGTDAHYTHKQKQAAHIWTVQHDLGKYPSVTVVDSANNTVIGNVTYLDLNTVQIVFSGAFSGTAYFN